MARDHKGASKGSTRSTRFPSELKNDRETAPAGTAPMLEISSQLQLGMFWQVQMTPWSFIYAFLLHNGRTEAHSNATPASSPNRCKRASLQAPRSTRTDKFERPWPEQTSLDNMQPQKHRGHHRGWAISLSQVKSMPYRCHRSYFWVPQIPESKVCFCLRAIFPVPFPTA